MKTLSKGQEMPGGKNMCAVELDVNEDLKRFSGAGKAESRDEVVGGKRKKHVMWHANMKALIGQKSPTSHLSQFQNGPLIHAVLEHLNVCLDNGRILNSLQELCEGCRHPWLSHQPPSMDLNNRNYARRRRACAATRCAGFTTRTPAWDYSTVCDCSAAWISHIPLSDGTSPPVAAGPTQPGASNSPPDVGSRAPPMDAFGGLPPPVAGNFGTRRAASGACSLAGHSPFTGSFANHFGSQTPFPGNSANSCQANPELDVIVVCWPMVLQDSEYQPPANPSPHIIIKNEHVKVYADRLKSFYLVVQVKVAGQDTTIPAAEFFQKIKQQLDAHQLSMPPCPPNLHSEGSAGDLHHQPFVLLKANVRNGNSLSSVESFRTRWPESTELIPGFGLHLVTAISSDLSTAFRHRQPHSLEITLATYGLRVLDPLSTSTDRNDPLELECYEDYCPSTQIGSILSSLMGGGPVDQRPLTPPSQASLVRHRSLQSQIIQPDRCVRQRQQSVERAQSPIEAVAADARIAQIHGRTIEAVAVCILKLGLQRNSNSRALTYGVGPERAALRQACTVLSTHHHFWQQAPSS
ncbi:hypothetical protein DFH08DRAFT_940039 [Mycena albidolilacea]|uniref:Uncharacterized protein n=1 Tax=Mycena albidolilacea TaxID=1033008 RepID=A0AAD6ZNM8_9AGAR|nr:hypothetical protein DFH08DRAFT_940039 [Mycena albidolilacea]